MNSLSASERGRRAGRSLGLPRDLASSVPLRLELLGRLHLVGDDAAHAELAAQPKRAAALAYLGLMQRHEGARRDVMTAMFWPESNTEHSRAALRKMIHGLRRLVSETAIISIGDEELVLDPAQLPCDVTEFGAAVEARRFEEALALYRGPLLDGFHAGATAFEHAVRVERRELEEAAALAAWQLAERQEKDEDPTGATKWARKAARLGNSDERLFRKVLLLLQRLGDRAGALALYEGFAARMRSELRAEPSEETQRLARDLRS